MRAMRTTAAPVLATLLTGLVILRESRFRGGPRGSAQVASAPCVSGGPFDDFRGTVFPATSLPREHFESSDVSLCDICYCPLGNNELPKGFEPRPQLRAQLSVGGPVEPADDIGPILRSVQLAAYCPQIHIYNTSTAEVLIRASPVDTLAFNVTSLVPRRDTLYWMMKTTPSGKLTADTRRPYFERHIATIKRHQAIVERGGYHDGAPPSQRQLLWVLVEDAPEIDQNVAGLLRDSGVPHFYFALGRTHSYGNAQQNGCYMAIHALSRRIDGVYGHGPIISIDDDAEIHERLLDIAWKIKRVGVWPVGNLGPAHDKWEGSETGQIVAWRSSNPVDTRLFQHDWNGVGFSSEILDADLRKDSPFFLKEDWIGGEDAWLKSIIKSHAEVEQVCGNGCEVAWHNQPLDKSTRWLSAS